MLEDGLFAVAEAVGWRLAARGETVGVAEGSCGGLVSAALLSVDGASRYYAGGAVIYTPRATAGFLRGAVPAPEGLRGATESFAAYLAQSVAARLDVTWGLGEGGAAGPSANPYGDPPGHCWIAVAGGNLTTPATHHLLTGSQDRRANMVTFATAALGLLLAQLEA